MNNAMACPSPARLRSLFEQVLSEDDEADLAAHLDKCEACRDRVTQLERELALPVQPIATSAELSRARQSLQEPPLPTARSGWQNETDEVVPSRHMDSAARVAPLSTELPGGYLLPSDDPQLLGRIGHYEILERIGNGGMGVVLKGRDPRLNRIVAIKVLAPHLAASGAARKRFGREARAAAAVAHENVVAIHAVEVIRDLPLLVMQFVPGVSLREKIDVDGPLEILRIVRIALQTAAGLAAAHAQGVIHRDIKPGNILLENGIEKVRLTDFGLATVSDDVALTQTGFLAGTPQYMSPEQIQGGVADARSDLFSLGSVMYEMCTGRAPFRGSNPYSVLHRVCQEQPRPIREINSDIPDWLTEIVERLLQKNPAARFQSADEVVAILRQRLTELQQPKSQQPPLSLSDLGPCTVSPPPDSPRSQVGGAATVKLGQSIDAPALAYPAVQPASRRWELNNLVNAKPPPKPNSELPAMLWGPTVGLQIAAVLQILAGAVLLVILVFTGVLGFSGAALSVAGMLLLAQAILLGIGIGTWQLIAALIAINCGSINQLRISAFLTAIPLSPTWPVGFPISLWAWINLRRHWEDENSVRWTPSERISFRPAEILLAVGLAGGAALALVLVWGNLRRPSHPAATLAGARPTNHLQEVAGLMLVDRSPRTNSVTFPLGPAPLAVIELERPATGAIAFARDGNLMAVGGRDGFVWLHFVRSGEKAMTLIQSREPVHRLAFAPDGTRLAAANDIAIDIWDSNTQSVLYSIEPAARGQSAGGKRLLYFLDQNRVVFDQGKDLKIQNGQSPAGSMPHPSPFIAGDVSPDGQFAATSDELGKVRIWNLSDASLRSSFEAGSGPAELQFLTGSLLVIGCGPQMSVCNLHGERLSEISLPADAWSGAATGWIATCWGEVVARVGSKPAGERRHGSIHVWNWANSTLAASFEGVADEPLGVAIDRVDRRLAIVTQQRISLFGLKDIQDARSIVGDLGKSKVLSPAPQTRVGNSTDPRFLCVDVTLNGETAVTGERDGSVSVWDLAAATRTHHWQTSLAAIRDVRFGPSDDYILSGDDAGNLALWTRFGERIWHTQIDKLLKNPSLGIHSVGFRPPYFLCGYKSRDSGDVTGLLALRVNRTGADCLSTEYEIRCNDIAIGRDGTAWVTCDRSLYRDRLVRAGNQPFDLDHSRHWESTDYLGPVATTGSGHAVVGTALSGSAQSRREPSDHACVRVIDPQQARVRRTLPTGPGEVTALAASEWRHIVAALDTSVAQKPSSEIIVWDAVLGSELVRWKLAERIRSVAFVPSRSGGRSSHVIVAGEALQILPLPNSESGN